MGYMLAGQTNRRLVQNVTVYSKATFVRSSDNNIVCCQARLMARVTPNCRTQGKKRNVINRQNLRSDRNVGAQFALGITAEAELNSVSGTINHMERRLLETLLRQAREMVPPNSL